MAFILRFYTIVFGLVLCTFQLIAQSKSIAQKKDSFSTNLNDNRVNLLDTSFLFSGLHAPLNIWIQLPKNYSKSKKVYPVIYLPVGDKLVCKNHEGNQWNINSTLDSLELAGKRTAIVVIIDADFKELLPCFIIDSSSMCMNYINYLADSLKPYIDKQFRTIKDRRNTLIAGSTFGANLSYFAFLNRNEKFGKAGLFSPEFNSMPALKNFTDSLAQHVSGKLFYYCGGFENEASLKEGEAIVQSLGEKSKAVIYSLADTEGFGNPIFWNKHFAAFIIWALADGNNSIINIKN